jgi:hypothetical protein
MTPTEFELQIARIQSALTRAKAKVRWNDRFPDPDNPSHLRQVDITVRRDKSLAIVECRYHYADTIMQIPLCRYHSRPQDVKWISGTWVKNASAPTPVGSFSNFMVNQKKNRLVS